MASRFDIMLFRDAVSTGVEVKAFCKSCNNEGSSLAILLFLSAISSIVWLSSAFVEPLHVELPK